MRLNNKQIHLRRAKVEEIGKKTKPRLLSLMILVG